MLTEPQLRAFLPGLTDTVLWVPALTVACCRFDITTPARLAAFLAQTAHESAGYRRLSENLNYGAAGLMKTWPRRFPTIESALPYARKPQKIASYVYANRNGNGPDLPGDPANSDGWRFRGRGLIQLTGRANYRGAALALQLPLEAYPDQVAGRDVAALTAAHFWSSRGCNPLADSGTLEDFDAITQKINGGQTGQADRRELWERAKAALA